MKIKFIVCYVTLGSYISLVGFIYIWGENTEKIAYSVVHDSEVHITAEYHIINAIVFFHDTTTFVVVGCRQINMLIKKLLDFELLTQKEHKTWKQLLRGVLQKRPFC